MPLNQRGRSGAKKVLSKGSYQMVQTPAQGGETGDNLVIHVSILAYVKLNMQVY